ncbi:MAG TPA: ATP-binding protein [Haliangiales bacterium]|nr:ATP-binding protein [Haliangiales bacterium]
MNLVSPRPRARGLVYLVDDDPLVLSSLGRLLELETPHTVRRFETSESALAAMRDEPPDLLISDLGMPGMDGLELLRRARAIAPGAARVVLTGFADKDNAIRAINDAGVYHFVEKPWDNDALLVTVQNAIDRVALERELHDTIAELRARNDELERALSELRDAQDRLVAAERLAAVGRLASGVAHEIGNQLSLLGYAELLADRFAGDPDVKELTDPLLAARRRLSSMVGSIREFVRGGGPTYVRERQPLAPIVDETLAILRFEPALKLRRIDRSPHDGDVSAEVNREKILQVLINLVRNAIQATREGGRIRIGVLRDGGEALMEVEDDGVGIAAEDLPRIWEPFFSTKGEVGTGLGLGICRRIIEEHGGTIDAASEPGRGARFTIRLPAAGLTTPA